MDQVQRISEANRLLDEAMTKAQMTLKSGKAVTPGSPEWDSIIRICMQLSHKTPIKTKILASVDDFRLQSTRKERHAKA